MKENKIKPTIYKNCKSEHLDLNNPKKWIEEHLEETEVN